MRILVAAMLLAAGAPAQQDKPFSHRVHLRLNLQCAACHAAAARSTRVEDNNLPERAVCLGCHKQAAVGPPRPTLLAHFHHAVHLRLGNIAPVIAAAIDKKTYLSPADGIRAQLNTNNACEACHRGLHESDAVSHANMPQMADCLVCHNRIEPPYSCEKCHAPDAKLKPATHTPDFLDTHTRPGAAIDKASCAVCHGRRFKCLGCH